MKPEEVLTEIQKHSVNGVALPSNQYRQCVMYGAIQHFGSWTEACEIAGVIPFRQYDKQAKKEKVVEETFKKLNQEHVKIFFRYLKLAKSMYGNDTKTAVDGAIKAARHHISGKKGKVRESV